MAGARKRARRAGALAAEEQGATAPAGQLFAVLEVCPPDRIRRDVDNVHAAMKGALDGVFDFLERDDSDVRGAAVFFGAVQGRGKGYVRLELVPWALGSAFLAPLLTAEAPLGD